MSAENDATLWTINAARFMLQLRREQCVTLAASRYNALAGKLLGIMFDLATASGHWNGVPESRAITFGEIKTVWDEMFNSNSEMPEKDRDRLPEYLNTILKDHVKLLRSSSDVGYILRFETIFGLLQQTEIDGIICQRYEPLALRLFRFINIHKYAEEAQISDECVAPPNVTKKLLMLMYQDHLLKIVTIPKTVDRHPLRCSFLYQADYDHCSQVFTDHTAKAVQNLLLRYQHLETASASLLEKVAEMSNDSSYSDQSISLSPVETRKLAIWRSTSAQLLSTISHLDNTLMLLNRFDSPWKSNTF